MSFSPSPDERIHGLLNVWIMYFIRDFFFHLFLQIKCFNLCFVCMIVFNLVISVIKSLLTEL